MANLFFSYSHRDEELRNELEIHLSQLKNEGIIKTWHDRRIPAGDAFENSISQHLEQADLVLLLVSPYFLASSYCYEIEMHRALARHKAGETRVIPVILHPCDWHTAPFARLLAAPKDGKPVSKFPNIHDAMLEVTQAIRKVLSLQFSEPSPPRAAAIQSSPNSIPAITETRSSNLRLKKKFTDRDRDSFLEDSYEYVANFFEESLRELETRNTGIAGRFQRITAKHFTAEIYQDGMSVSACGIRLDAAFGHGQIAFSFDPNSTNSMNEAVRVEDDGYSLFLRATGMSMITARDVGDTGQLTQEGAAEFYWSLLIRSLQ